MWVDVEKENIDQLDVSVGVGVMADVWLSRRK